jgi:hypothetical protein
MRTLEPTPRVGRSGAGTVIPEETGDFGVFVAGTSVSRELIVFHEVD